MTRRAKNESMDERIRQEARRVAARLHPDEFGQPVSIYYLLDKGIIQNLIPGYENETIRGKNLLKTKFYREYVKQAKILLAAWSKVISAGVERENPQDIRTLTQGIFDKSRSSGPTGSRRIETEAEVRNEHGVLFTYTVYANRTRNRWWLQLLVGEKPDPSWDWTERAKHAGRQSLHYSFGTSSPQKAQDWIDQVNRLASGRVNPKDSPLASLLLLPGPGLLEEEIALAGALVNPLSFTLDPRHVLRHGTVMRRPLPRPSSPRLPRGVTPPIPKGRTTLYKGVRIIPTEEGWRTSLEYESIFDTIRDAKRFVDAQKRNPRRKTA